MNKGSQKRYGWDPLNALGTSRDYRLVVAFIVTAYTFRDYSVKQRLHIYTKNKDYPHRVFMLPLRYSQVNVHREFSSTKDMLQQVSDERLCKEPWAVQDKAYNRAPHQTTLDQFPSGARLRYWMCERASNGPFNTELGWTRRRQSSRASQVSVFASRDCVFGDVDRTKGSETRSRERLVQMTYPEMQAIRNIPAKLRMAKEDAEAIAYHSVRCS